jgi:uncharacterized membrane protein YadS
LVCSSYHFGLVIPFGERVRKGSHGSSRPCEEVAYAVGHVTLCGTQSVALLRLFQGPAGLNDVPFGVWVSASVHDTGQVPEVVTELASAMRTLLLAVGLGAAARARDVRRLGLRPLALGLLSWILLCGGALTGVLAVGPR